MTPVVHLCLLALLLSSADGSGLEGKKVSFENMVVEVPEGTPVPYVLYQFQVAHPSVNGFRLSGEGSDAIKISEDGWLYLDKPLDWSHDDNYLIAVEALADDKVVEGPIYVTINVLDVNNHAPVFNQSYYTALVRENAPAGVPFIRVFASDRDDPSTPNAQLRYSLVSQIPNRDNTLLFQVDPVTGEISTSQQGEHSLKASEAIQYARGEERGVDTLKAKFDHYCPAPTVPHEDNPFFACVERAETRRRNLNPLGDPDYTLFVRVQDMGGASDTALSGNTRVHIAVQPNLWVNPGRISIEEHGEGSYPRIVTKVQSNHPNAVYRLVQKERELSFPFQITEDGEILLTEELDREEKDMYILVVMAEDDYQNQVDPPMEIQVVVEDVNDNAPVCVNEESVFEVQEDEPVGSLVGQLLAHDGDEEGTLNALLTYAIVSQQPPTSPDSFAIDAASGRIQALRSLQRRENQVYKLTVRVSDPAYSADCKVVVKVIDVNNELPLFEKNDYGSHTLAEDADVGHTVLSVAASDADDPESGSSYIEFHISEGNEDEVFAVETDGKGVGHLVVAKPLDFETSASYKLKIDARNPEPLMSSLEYGDQSSAVVSLSVTDVDEVPEFTSTVLDVSVPENATKGAVLLTVEAKDPEGKDIRFKMEGDPKGWLEMDAATGEIRTKDKLDRETLETFEVKVMAYEKDNPDKWDERVVSVRLLDVNDNVPKLTETQAFICVQKPEAVFIKARDADAAPFSQPFTFAFAHGKKSHNWDLQVVDGTSAKLTLKKTPTEDKTFSLPINVKDNAGMGVTQAFEVHVCTCTELGYCYTPPAEHGFKYGLGPTVGILAGILAFCVIVFVVVIKRSSKQKAATEERNALM
uniref:cadherin-17 n=1 Tax=Doryrhamphus excisus TaxID=161450 RepID=UPI0025AE392E|nr:cadherin-17 [Doryrhamphus excisus]XP_057940810.1 cadherin-17 [Doryrhamphus excisus]XP_057940812.1 cadherin-17 [Doryrhamphus excisus]XP_057940813.1 cadherin-17 [Doryrhamphus excisus]